jgi:hypothetical protein
MHGQQNIKFEHQFEDDLTCMKFNTEIQCCVTKKLNLGELNESCGLFSHDVSSYMTQYQ